MMDDAKHKNIGATVVLMLNLERMGVEGGMLDELLKLFEEEAKGCDSNCYGECHCFEAHDMLSPHGELTPDCDYKECPLAVMAEPDITKLMEDM